MASIPNADAYFESLGRFVHAYATLEVAVQTTLWSHVRAELNIARAIFSGLRVRDAIGNIKRIREATNVSKDSPESQQLERVFAQIGDLTSARNQILHSGAWATDKGTELQSTNWLHAYDEDKISGLKVSPEILDNMTADVDRCALMLVNFGQAVAQRDPIDPADYPEEWARPWRYKSSEQAIRPKAPGARTPKQKPKTGRK